MVAPRPILKSLPLYTPDMTMKHARTCTDGDCVSDTPTSSSPSPSASPSEYQYQYPSTSSPSFASSSSSSASFSSTYALPQSPALPFASTSHIPPLESPHVHFPPTPILTQMAMTHSAWSYDRKPIEVQPNELALPARGAREVEDDDDDDDGEDKEEGECEHKEVGQEEKRGEKDMGEDAAAEEEDARALAFALARARSGPTPNNSGGVERLPKKTAWNLQQQHGADDAGYFHLRPQTQSTSYEAEVMDSMDMEVEEAEEQHPRCSTSTRSPMGRRNCPKSSSSSSSSSSCTSSKPKSRSSPRSSRPQTPFAHPSARSITPSPEEGGVEHPQFDILGLPLMDPLSHPPPPPLVFDPSSESDSDQCISPGDAECHHHPAHPSSQPHLAQVAVRLAGLDEHEHEPMHDDSVDAAYGHGRIPASSSLLTRKRCEERHAASARHGHGHGHGADGKRHKSSPHTHHHPRTHTRTRILQDASDEAAGFSSFYEGSLDDGCLGGF